jgi:hypothetical protein
VALTTTLAVNSWHVEISEKDLRDPRLYPPRCYDGVRTCKFCAQFFDSEDYKVGWGGVLVLLLPRGFELLLTALYCVARVQKAPVQLSSPGLKSPKKSPSRGADE